VRSNTFGARWRTASGTQRPQPSQHTSVACH